ncbi:MAG: GTPase HflX [Desulfotomaculum sp. BICA1-6]|nr:MAG: GTPase HflX [Desulfotomaculum sp. BICA1-6]
MHEVKGEKKERVILAALELPGMESEDVEESLIELAGLAETAGAEVVDSDVQRRQRPNFATYFGKGKVEELAERARQLEADLLIVDRELQPAQRRNLEENMELPVVDRTQLILDIFARRARTREGKMQVELAQLQYLLPRLTGLGTQLSRLGGGIGTRGPGETKLEVDRRRIRKRITDLKNEIEEVRRHRALLRRGRQTVTLPLATLVGYTNAGKSTLLNALTGSDVLAEDKLFATLDPTTRRVVLPTGDAVLLIDTVGFIQNLPHHLVAAFRATLEEVVEADIIIHVVDTSHPRMDAQMSAVEKVLTSLQVEGKPRLTVYNKVDRVDGTTGGLQSPSLPEGVAVSALRGGGLDEMLKRLSVMLAAGRVTETFFVPYHKSSVLPLIHENGWVLEEEHGPEGLLITAELGMVWASRVRVKLKQ